MERAIPKSKGQEFGSLLHQLGADFIANPFSPQVRELLLSIAPDAKERFPKRVVKKPEPPAPPPEPPGKKKSPHAAPRSGGQRTARQAQRQTAASGQKESDRLQEADRGARHSDGGKKKLTSPKTKMALKPLAKRKPR